MAGEFLQVETTTDSHEAAVALARSLVEARLAACAQVVGPITSVYWWEDGAQNDEEYLILVKTTASRYEALEAHIRERHTYDVPEIIAMPITAGSRDYLDWVGEETRAP